MKQLLKIWLKRVLTVLVVVSAIAVVFDFWQRKSAEHPFNFLRSVFHEKTNVPTLKITSPEPNSIISSPLHLEGEASSAWFILNEFEILLEDGQGKAIAQTMAQGIEGEQKDTMLFEAVLEFEKPQTSNGSLVFVRGDEDTDGFPQIFRLPVRLK